MSLFVVLLLIGIVNQYSNGYSNNSKFPLYSFQVRIKSVLCPDGESYCPDNETCCKLSSGQYGCCPLPNAVCCNDNLHCCPTGYRCDVEHSRCEKGFRKSYYILCPDGEMLCSHDETCCQLQSGKYACCPLRDAVCCSDYVHCCPYGYRCQIDLNKCQKNISIRWFRKNLAFPIKNILSSKLIYYSLSNISRIQSSDEISNCSQLNNKSYVCCLYRQGSSSYDKIHYCQKSSLCHHSCSRSIQNFNLIDKIKIKSERLIRLSIIENKISPYGKRKYSFYSICCRNKDKKCRSYSSCSYSEDIYYSWNYSYFPQYKYICDEKELSSQLNKRILIENQSLNKCGSTNVVCPYNKTCCKTSQSNSDQYACCHYSNGVCCNDGRHCCPKGTICHYKSGACIIPYKCWIVVCISDTHQKHRQLTDRLKSSHSGDILIHAGDITNFARGSKPFYDFDQWLSELPFRHKLIIAGNHDSILSPSINHGRFLEDEQVIIDDYLRIYGSSWRPTGQSTWSDIPSNPHIVITHNPPCSPNGSHVDLEPKLELRLHEIRPLLSIFGHIHSDYGVWKQSNGVLFANAASLPSSRSQILNDPLRFKISIDENSMTSIEHLISK
ncbi:unnamed protein product [Rotaria sordida]|uniref:Granulins domain-containing protein n=1 Tax=Rotaria sordida TaxID=392033 RepID=A0A814TVL7_9BILA|nr:unnamed protein product [Rotaria sordida]CAF1166002.1 unnamed protein product [Rotaria sordida]